MAKARWYDREILEVVSTEFRDRSVEYYRFALDSGVTTINGKVAKPDTVVRNGDRIENIVHRHEPPVTSTPVRVLYEDLEREFIVIDKPGSIPVHATGRFFYLSLVEILQREFGYKKVYTVNRLDRLTSGLMVVGLSSQRAHTLSTEFVAGTVRKEYIARCAGEFPAEEVTVEEPLLTVDRQMGLNIVHPEGKPAKTIFKRLHYDVNTDTSVLHCRPLTGRSHQIRVHLQYLGHPIANDPIYSETKIWGAKLGRGGIDVKPSTERSAPVPPPQFQTLQESEHVSKPSEPVSTVASTKLLPRETGQDIGMGSPVPLSAEAVGIITRLRNMKDEDEDWSRWRDVVFKTKGRLHPQGMKVKPLPPQNRRKRGGPSWVDENSDKGSPAPSDTGVYTPASDSATPAVDTPLSIQGDAPALESAPEIPQFTESEVLERLQRHALDPQEPAIRVAPPPDGRTSELRTRQAVAQVTVAAENDGMLYCPECYLPLHPDPKPERLYIFLHALRYTTSLGTFETGMPEWATEGWEWDRS